MTNLSSILQHLRETYGWTQQQLARMMNVSRVTIANIETGKRPVNAKDLKQYSEIFDLPIQAIQQGITSVPKFSVTPGNTVKFKELLLYILHKVGMKPNIGKTVLYKLLYFCDFDMCEKYGESITGMSYIKLPKGPAPYKFDEIVQEMKKKNEILTIDATYGGYSQQRLLPNKTFQCIFSPQEYEVIETVLRLLSDANASEISEYSHGDAPWKETKDMEIIKYGLVTKRKAPYSVLDNERICKESAALFQSSDAFNFLLDEPDLYNDYVK